MRRSRPRMGSRRSEDPSGIRTSFARWRRSSAILVSRSRAPNCSEAAAGSQLPGEARARRRDLRESLERDELEPEVADAVEDASQMRLVFNPRCQNRLAVVGMERRRLNHTHEPIDPWPPNDETIGLLTAHAP